MISVREISAVQLCKHFLKTEAQLVLDPTLLLSPNAYEDLCVNIPSERGLLFYVLDISDNILNQIQTMGRELNVKTFTRKHSYSWAHKKVYPGVEEWIAGFRDAHFVVTDSFHGTVFSIIFNKPFLTIYNPLRGNARLESLLNLFDLTRRLVVVDQLTKGRMEDPIDWISVNKKINQLKKKSLDMLFQNLH
ncbi:MAG: polysaccharide pyruvyl transferase family protein [Rikenellaceae bacterium]|nr:polysaccharide pyruvyl transferase family protein [Rikenellaceae bacterium]